MGLVEFKIELDRQRFYPGEVVTGGLTIVLDTPKSHQGVVLRVEGKGHLKWIRDRTAFYSGLSGDETYFVVDITLIPDGLLLSSGTHRIPFGFCLPRGIPCSFEGQHGYVRYTATGRIVRPWILGQTIAQITDEKVIQVQPFLDLNLDPQLGLGVSDEDTKDICCLCFGCGPIAASASLPKSGYAIGETILLEGVVNNQSDTAVDVWAGLYQLVDYHNNGSWKDVARTAVRTVEPNKSFVWSSGEKLEVSRSLLPTDLGGPISALFSVTYQLRVFVDPIGPSLKMCLTLPITIGTVPVRPT